MNDISNSAFSMIADYGDDVNQVLSTSFDGNVPILATRNMVLFPGVVSPVLLGRSASINLVNTIRNQQNAVFAIFAQKMADTEMPITADLYEEGVLAKLVRVIDHPGQTNEVTAIVQGLGRCRLERMTGFSPFLTGIVHSHPENLEGTDNSVFNTAIDDLRKLTINYIQQNEDIPDEALFSIENINNNIILLNYICSGLFFPVNEKINMLKEDSMQERVILALRALNRDMQLLELKQNIRTRTRHDLDEQQKEYFL